jgi:hypothetical protein
MTYRRDQTQRLSIVNTALLTDPEITKRRHRAALNDLIDGARRGAAAAVVATNSAPDSYRAAVLEQTHEQLTSIVERLQQLT